MLEFLFVTDIKSKLLHCKINYNAFISPNYATLIYTKVIPSSVKTGLNSISSRS